jgi:hypothetical protein
LVKYLSCASNDDALIKVIAMNTNSFFIFLIFSF